MKKIKLLWHPAMYQLGYREFRQHYECLEAVLYFLFEIIDFLKS